MAAPSLLCNDAAKQKRMQRTARADPSKQASLARVNVNRKSTFTMKQTSATSCTRQSREAYMARPRRVEKNHKKVRPRARGKAAKHAWRGHAA
jgi:hypothetical protein